MTDGINEIHNEKLFNLLKEIICKKYIILIIFIEYKLNKTQ